MEDEFQEYVEDEDSLSEEAMLEDFEAEDEVEECAECGAAVREKGVKRDMKDENLDFCSEACADDYEEGVL
jgi:hypothetical protein